MQSLGGLSNGGMNGPKKSFDLGIVDTGLGDLVREQRAKEWQQYYYLENYRSVSPDSMDYLFGGYKYHSSTYLRIFIDDRMNKNDSSEIQNLYNDTSLLKNFHELEILYLDLANLYEFNVNVDERGAVFVFLSMFEDLDEITYDYLDDSQIKEFELKINDSDIELIETYQNNWNNSADNLNEYYGPFRIPVNNRIEIYKEFYQLINQERLKFDE